MKAMKFIIVLIFCNVALLSAQKTGAVKTSSNHVVIDSLASDGSNSAFVSCEDPATFRGEGIESFRNYFKSNLRFTESQAIKYKDIVVFFCVNKYGKIVDIQILRGVDHEFDNEIIRVLNESNNAYTWKPGAQGGKPIKQSFAIGKIFDSK